MKVTYKWPLIASGSWESFHGMPLNEILIFPKHRKGKNIADERKSTYKDTKSGKG